MDVLHDLLTNLGETRVQDVHVSGFLETEYGHPRFVPLSNTIYLDLGTRFLRLDTTIGSGVLALTVVAAMTPPPELDGEDEEFMTASIGDLFFDSGGPLPITRVRYAVVGESTADRPVVRCVEFRIGHTACLFFDPWWLSGIRLAVTGDYETWRREEQEWSTTIQEFVWEPSTKTAKEPRCPTG